jgi:hypothetical protein
MQLVLFADGGTAWSTSSPFSKANTMHTIIVNNGDNVQVRAHYARDPFVGGVGYGFRFSLLGYMVRIDKGWGFAAREFQKPVWHISLGMDF